MYNKLFTKILDSSVWMEETATRIVWITFIAAMDEDGFVQLAGIENVAHRARVTVQEAEAALLALESPDTKAPGQPNDGRRVERVPGGWMVVNSEKYRLLVSRAIEKEQTRIRVAKYRANKKSNAACNAPVTPSESATEAEAEADRPPVPPAGGKACVSVVVGTAPPIPPEPVVPPIKPPPDLSPPESFPPGFPASAEEAAKHAGFLLGCTEDFARSTWNKAAGRGGRDAKDVPIRNFRHHLAAEWGYHQERARQNLRNMGEQGVSPSVQMIRDQEELKRAEKRMETIRASVDSHRDLEPKDRAELKALKDRAEILKKQIGFQV